MSPSCVINDTSVTAAAHHHHLPPRHHSPLHASVPGSGDFSDSRINVPQIALPAAALCSPSLHPVTTEPRHLSTKEPPRQPLSTVPAAAHRSDGATSSGGGVWRSKSHGGCFRNQHVAPCDDDDDDDCDGDGDKKEKQGEEDGGDDDWLVTYSRTSTSYSRPAPVAPATDAVRTTSLKFSYPVRNPLAFGAAVAAGVAAASAPASAATTTAAGNAAEEEEEEDFNAWMLSGEEATGSAGTGRNVTAGKGGGAAGVGQSQACGRRGGTDGGPDGDESEWSAALMDPGRSDRRSSTGGRRRSSRLSAGSSRRRNAMEYSELDAIRERLLHATQLWAITVADSSTDAVDADAAAAAAAAAASAAAAATTAVAVTPSGGGAAVETQQLAQATAASPAAGPGYCSSVATAATAVVAGRLSNAGAGNSAGKPRISDNPNGCSSDARRRSGVFAKTKSAASGSPVTVTSRRSMSRSLSAAGFAAVAGLEASAAAAMVIAGGATPGKADGAKTTLKVSLPGASSSAATAAARGPDSCCSNGVSASPTGPTFTFGPTGADDVSPTSAAASSGTSASAHGLTCSETSPPHVAESPFSRISTFLMRRLVSPFPIVRSSTYPVLR
ncbi:unnamed protein product [Closterium sp. Yama58-4]|nr:unnamed protein product [Closterium sp. Yama58-4]